MIADEISSITALLILLIVLPAATAVIIQLIQVSGRLLVVVIGLVLGEIIERSYHLSIQTFGWSFLLRPLTLILLAFTILTLLYPVIWGKEKEAEA